MSESDIAIIKNILLKQRKFNDTLYKCFLEILNLIDAELNYGSKDYDIDFI